MLKSNGKATGILGFGILFMLLAGIGFADETQQVRETLGRLLPDSKPDSVMPTPVPGLFEVVMGPRVFYITKDGAYLINGRLIDIEKRRDLTEPAIARAKREAIERVGEDKMVIFSPDEFKHTVTVFTDIDCGYCRKLHSEMADYNKLGIRIRYLFYPRAGLGSHSYQKAVSVWCADDRNQAMDAAKSGREPDPKTCDNPVLEHMLLGEQMGVTGTPALVLEDGSMLPGYIPAQRMSDHLSEQAQRQ